MPLSIHYYRGAALMYTKGSFASEHEVFGTQFPFWGLEGMKSPTYYQVDRVQPVILPSRAKVRVRIRLKRRRRLTERGRLL